jgi:hypothetical protein
MVLVSSAGRWVVLVAAAGGRHDRAALEVGQQYVAEQGLVGGVVGVVVDRGVGLRVDRAALPQGVGEDPRDGVGLVERAAVVVALTAGRLEPGVGLLKVAMSSKSKGSGLLMLISSAVVWSCMV